MGKFLSVATTVVVVALLTACGNKNSAVIPRSVQGAASNCSSRCIHATSTNVGAASNPLSLTKIMMHTSRNNTNYSNAPETLPLNTNGGSVDTISSHVYIDFWGNGWFSDPSQEAQYLPSFVSAIGGSAWSNIVTQYTQCSTRNNSYVCYWAGNGPAAVQATWYDGVALPSLTDSSIIQEVRNAATHFGNPPAAVYIIATPTNYSEPGFGSIFCAWHNATAVDGLVFTYFPYVTDSANCGLTPYGNGAISIVAGHELAEISTAPYPPNGWRDAQNEEIGDKCAWWSPGIQAVPMGSRSYVVQSLWSNHDNACVLSDPNFGPNL